MTRARGRRSARAPARRSPRTDRRRAPGGSRGQRRGVRCVNGSPDGVGTSRCAASSGAARRAPSPHVGAHDHARRRRRTGCRRRCGAGRRPVAQVVHAQVEQAARPRLADEREPQRARYSGKIETTSMRTSVSSSQSPRRRPGPGSAQQAGGGSTTTRRRRRRPRDDRLDERHQRRAPSGSRTHEHVVRRQVHRGRRSRRRTSAVDVRRAQPGELVVVELVGVLGARRRSSSATSSVPRSASAAVRSVTPSKHDQQPPLVRAGAHDGQRPPAGRGRAGSPPRGRRVPSTATVGEAVGRPSVRRSTGTSPRDRRGRLADPADDVLRLGARALRGAVQRRSTSTTSTRTAPSVEAHRRRCAARGPCDRRGR